VIIEDLLGPGWVVWAQERRRAKGRGASPEPSWPGLLAAHMCRPGLSAVLQQISGTCLFY